MASGLHEPPKPVAMYYINMITYYSSKRRKNMSALSIRKLPKEIDKALREEARVRKITKTEIVLQALQERFHLGEFEMRRRGIRDFFGRMTKDQYASFKKATAPFSEIEEDLWK